MTLDEFSVQFDILYNNISSGQAPGLTEYEKSVFLTQAQEAVILDLYKGTAGDSFETTEEVTRYLYSLVKTKSDFIINDGDPYYIDLTIVPDLWFITYQSAIQDDRDVIVVPVKQDLLFKTLQNPFTGPSKNRILSISEDEKLSLYCLSKPTRVTIKYLKRPSNIDLEGGTEVEVPESLHTQILMRAIQMAKAVWAS